MVFSIDIDENNNNKPIQTQTAKSDGEDNSNGQ